MDEMVAQAAVSGELGLPVTHALALRPADMEKCQKLLIAWCDTRIQEFGQEEAEAKANEEAARRGKFRLKPFQVAASKARRSALFYEKVKLALAAGYYMIPAFPLDILAIRTDEDWPDKEKGTYRDDREQGPKSLPPGEGEYVSPFPGVKQVGTKIKDDGGKVAIWGATEWREIGFPATLAKPAIVDAFTQARAMKLFDEIGLVGSPRGKDPILVGRIVRPHLRAFERQREPRRRAGSANFLLAWWMDYRAF